MLNEWQVLGRESIRWQLFGISLAYKEPLRASGQDLLIN